MIPEPCLVENIRVHLQVKVLYIKNITIKNRTHHADDICIRIEPLSTPPDSVSLVCDLCDREPDRGYSPLDRIEKHEYIVCGAVLSVTRQQYEGYDEIESGDMRFMLVSWDGIPAQWHY